jgi:trehalose 6-phosphate phosphatase
MKQVLNGAQSLLAAFVRPSTLLAFDFDGTLAPIVNVPEHAKMADSTRVRLDRLAQLAKVAIITGRSCADVASRLHGVRALPLVGNHGLEPSPREHAWAEKTRSDFASVCARLRRIAGVQLEDKQMSFAVHYRRSPHRGRARRKIMRVLQELGPSVRLVAGKAVINVLPTHQADKSQGTWALCEKLDCDSLVYVGDDVTDEDVFRASRGRDMIGVRIGRSRKSAAAYYLRRQRDIDDFLDVLIARTIALRGTRGTELAD